MNHTRLPPDQPMTKSAIHPSRWMPATLNANDRHQRMAGEEYRCQDANYRHSAAWDCSSKPLSRRGFLMLDDIGKL